MRNMASFDIWLAEEHRENWFDKEDIQEDHSEEKKKVNWGYKFSIDPFRVL
jgi:hypothetical protein